MSEPAIEELASKIAARMKSSAPPARGHYPTFVGASYSHALTMILRRQRLILAAVITFLPVLIPLALAFLSTAKFADDGTKIFVRLTEQVHINVLAPLLALFFASMLVGEDVETQTMPYVLTRPLPRSAWVLGRFGAYLTATAVILDTSIGLTFCACTSLSGLTFTRPDLILLAHYWGVAIMALLGYGAVAAFLGAVTKRPIIIGVILLYAWQRVATFVPGVIDFLTIQKYTDALLPKLAEQRTNVAIQTAIGTFQKEIFLVSATKAAITLVVISAIFLAITIFAVRIREYASARAAGG